MAIPPPATQKEPANQQDSPTNSRKLSRAQANNVVRRLQDKLSPAARELSDKILQNLDDEGSVVLKTLHTILFPMAETKSASAQLSKLLRTITDAAQTQGLSLGFIYEGAKDQGTAKRRLWFTGPPPTPIAELEGLSAIPENRLIIGQTGMPVGEAPVVALITYNENEFAAVRKTFWADDSTPPATNKHHAGQVVSVDELGQHGNVRVLHYHSRQGNRESQRAASDLHLAYKPAAIVSVGIAFGVDEHKQKVGDVLVSKFIVDYESARVNKNGSFTLANDRPPASRRLVRTLETLDVRNKHDHSKPDWPTLEFGGMLTGEKLVDNHDYRENLKAIAGQGGIVGGEMEAAGIAKALDDTSVDWIVVKAICDFADGNKGEGKENKQKLAATNAAMVIKAMLDDGQLYGDIAEDAERPHSTANAVTDKLAATALRRQCLERVHLEVIDDGKHLVSGQYGYRAELHALEAASYQKSQDNDPRKVVAFDDILTWLSEPEERPIYALLGEYGMGKTTTLQRVTAHLRQQRNQNVDSPAPLYFDLRKVDTLLAASALHPGKVPTLQETINDCLRNGYLQTDGVLPTYEDVVDSIDNGALVIFDGLDEVLSRIGDKQGLSFTANLLRVLPEARERQKNKAQSKLPRVLLSCRTQFFRSLSEQDNHLTGEHRGSHNQSQYRALLLQPLTEQQIRSYMTAVFPNTNIEQLMAQIEAVHNLRELAGRPFTLKLVADFVPMLEQWRAQGKRVTGATLYREVAKQWLIRDKEKQSFQPEDKLLLASALAAHFWRNKLKGITAKQLESWLGQWLAQQGPYEDFQTKPRDLLQEDLRNSTFLKRVDVEGKDSRFEFAHTSLQEFFLAEYLLQALLSDNADARDAWRLPMVSNETLDFLGQLLAEWAPDAGGPAPLQTLAVWRSPYLALASELQLAYGLRAHASGWPLPRLDGMDLQGADLSDWRFGSRREAPLPSSETHRRLNLAGCNFSHGNLRRAKFWNVDLRAAVFDHSHCDQAEVLHCELANSSWAEAAADGMQMRPQVASEIRAAWVPPGHHVEAQRKLAWLRGHTSGVTSCTFSPDGHSLLSASHDNTLRLWETATGTLLRVFVGHADTVTSCVFSRDGHKLLSASLDKTLRLWETATGTLLREFVGHLSSVTSCVFSPDGQSVLSASMDTTLRLWEVATGKLLRIIVRCSSHMTSCAFSPDGQSVLSASTDTTLRLWETATGRLLREFVGHTDCVTSCAFSPDGHSVLSASEDKTLRLWEIAPGRLLREFVGHTDCVTSCAFSPDGHSLLSASDDETLRLWETTTGTLLQKFVGHTDRVTSCAFSPDGRNLLSASKDKTLRLWEISTFTLLREFVGNSSWVAFCAFSPDGFNVITGSNDKSLHLWETATGTLLREFVGTSYCVTSCAFSPDGHSLLSGTYEGYLILLETATGTQLRTFSGHGDIVHFCAFSPDGHSLLSASYEGTLHLWETATGKLLRKFVGHSGTVLSCAFSPDGHSMLSATDKTLRLWETATGTLLQEFVGHTGAVTSCAFSPNGYSVLSASYDSTLRLWETATGTLLQEFFGHADWVTSCAFSPDGSSVLSASDDSTLRLWESATGTLLQEFVGHTDWVTSCVFSPDGRNILSTSDDNTIRLWDAATGQTLRVSTIMDGGAAAWIPATNTLLNASGNVWRYLKWRAMDENNWPVVWQLSPDEMKDALS
ncbi:NACHT domain-containing protein [Undibacterium sp. TS12]|uniref:phosphorylase family protein n=1 Tax=Undibacterium sp. TS12 TaxID=2908202 RepID=UPI001F4CCD54|nr:NACHT domain-containing protein [Undibacterium sp. TS12]MCH8619512.1 NACHT domain-containing protein [Undibacterium sp. TS12]